MDEIAGSRSSARRRYRARRCSGSGGRHEIFGALIEEVRFAMDSPVEEAVSSEPVSESRKFPVTRENTGNFRNYVADAPKIDQSRPRMPPCRFRRAQQVRRFSV